MRFIRSRSTADVLGLALLFFVFLSSSCLLTAQAQEDDDEYYTHPTSSSPTVQELTGSPTIYHSPLDDPPVGKCGRSIFETQIPYWIGVPELGDLRLSDTPMKHPNVQVCGGYSKKDSCCTERMLTELTDWSSSVDASLKVANYTGRTLAKDPGRLFDAALVYIRALAYEPYDMRNYPRTNWTDVRDIMRRPIGDIILAFWQGLFEPYAQFRSAFVTYQEGLLCSACEPNFERFLNGSGLVIQEEAATDVASAIDKFVAAFDQVMQNQSGAIAHVIHLVCLETAYDREYREERCAGVPQTVEVALRLFAGQSLREFLCGTANGVTNNSSTVCKDFIFKKVIRGLKLDFEPMLNNSFTYIRKLCSLKLGGRCYDIEGAQRTFLKFLFTFDNRPSVNNIYSPTGFDIKAAACASHLSGYGCGGNGQNSKSDIKVETSANAAPILVTFAVLVGVGAVSGVIFFLYRERKKLSLANPRAWYLRMREDGSSSTTNCPPVAPLV